MSSKKRSTDIRSRNVFHSMNSALEGILHTLKYERNMRIHFIIGILVILFGVYLKLTNVEFMLLCFAIAFVLLAEMFNTAVEHTVDLINDEFHPLAKIIKDIAAGAVVVAVVNAVVTGYFLLAERLGLGVYDGIRAVEQTPYQVTVIAIFLVAGIVFLIKFRRHEKSLLRGGMPSGHTAVAFSVATAVTFIAANAVVSILVFFLALLVGRSRVLAGVHSFLEVTAGALLGGLITVLAFQLLF